MPIEITMPKLSDTMEEGTILQWRVKEGDNVKRGQIIAEVETDKAAMEMEAFEDGVVSSLKVKAGESVAVGAVIAVFAGKGEENQAKSEKVKAPQSEKREVKESEKKKTEAEGAAEPNPESKEAKGENERQDEEPKQEKARMEEVKSVKSAPSMPPPAQGVTVSPVARKLALEKGLDLGRIRGTGPGGRIVLSDVERAAPEKTPAPAEVTGRAERKVGKSVKIRRIVARKMLESWQTIPHFFVTVAVDMTDVIRIRKDIDVSINDFILAAIARSLHEHPWVNSHWLDGEAVEQESIDIAMAVATDRGLYNPVIRDCGKLSLKEISRRARALADKAHLGKLEHADLEGGTFTISNMGMLGVESFTAIITPPQVAVLAVGTVKGEVVVDDQGEPGIAPILRLTLSADHRTLDGADAAEFLATLKSYLEAPVTLVTCHFGTEEE